MGGDCIRMPKAVYVEKYVYIRIVWQKFLCRKFYIFFALVFETPLLNWFGV